LAAFDARGAIVNLAVDGPFAALVLLGALSPLAYYGRLLVVGVARPVGGPAEPVGWRPVVSPVDLTDIRAWATRTWSDNVTVSATVGAALLAILAVAVSAGAFGVSPAAAGLPPTIEVSTESFSPGEPEAPLESAAPDGSEAPGESTAPAESAAPGESAAPATPAEDGVPSATPAP
jgi:hypothetical protein